MEWIRNGSSIMGGLMRVWGALIIVSLTILGSCSVKGNPYPKSDHFDGKKFHNLENIAMNSFWSFLKWKLEGSVKEWPEFVSNNSFPLPQLGSQDRAQLTFINHATFLLQLPGVNVLTDPFYSERTSPLKFAGPKRVRRPGLEFESLPPIDVVLISHNHYDHLDIETLKRLDKKFHPLFIVPLGNEKLLKSAGIQNVSELDWWNEFRIKDVLITFAPAQHWSSRGLLDKNESLWGSYMITSRDFKVYFGGDTGYSTHFELIKRRLGRPDVALLPIGAYEPRWFMKHHHMNPEEAVFAHKDLGDPLSIAMHFGTVQLTNEGYEEPVEDLNVALKKLSIPDKEFIVLDHGESRGF